MVANEIRGSEGFVRVPWRLMVPTLDFIPSMKGSHLRLRAE